MNLRYAGSGLDLLFRLPFPVLYMNATLDVQDYMLQCYLHSDPGLESC